MIFKINSNFDNISDIFQQLQQYNTIFINNTLYVSSDKNISINKLKQIFGDNCFISPITIQSLQMETSAVQQWCKHEFIQQDILRYEQNNQKKLNEIMLFLDDVEKEVFC